MHFFPIYFYTYQKLNDMITACQKILPDCFKGNFGGTVNMWNTVAQEFTGCFIGAEISLVLLEKFLLTYCNEINKISIIKNSNTQKSAEVTL